MPENGHFLSKLYMLKSMGRGQHDAQKQDDLIILRTLVEAIWDFVQAKLLRSVLLNREVWHLLVLLPPQPLRKSE